MPGRVAHEVPGECPCCRGRGVPAVLERGRKPRRSTPRGLTRSGQSDGTRHVSGVAESHTLIAGSPATEVTITFHRDDLVVVHGPDRDAEEVLAALQHRDFEPDEALALTEGLRAAHAYGHLNSPADLAAIVTGLNAAPTLPGPGQWRQSTWLHPGAFFVLARHPSWGVRAQVASCLGAPKVARREAQANSRWLVTDTLLVMAYPAAQAAFFLLIAVIQLMVGQWLLAMYSVGAPLLSRLLFKGMHRWMASNLSTVASAVPSRG